MRWAIKWNANIHKYTVLTSFIFLDKMSFHVYFVGLCSPSVHRGGWKWMLPAGWPNPLYEVPHQASQASCPVIDWRSITQCSYESNPKAQDLFICRFCLLNRALFSIAVQVWAWMCFVKRYVCMQINCLFGRFSAEVMYCPEKKNPCILYFQCPTFIVFCVLRHILPTLCLRKQIFQH